VSTPIHSNRKDRYQQRKPVPPPSHRGPRIPGYGGHVQRLGEEFGHTYALLCDRLHEDGASSDIPLKPPVSLPPQQYYERATFPGCLRNRSNIQIGDVRYEDWQTMKEGDFIDHFKGEGNGDEGYTEEELEAMYTTGRRRVGSERVDIMIQAMRDKINQRTRGGAFLMQRSLRYFDKDDSGGIDPDELREGLRMFGLQFSDEEATISHGHAVGRL